MAKKAQNTKTSVELKKPDVAAETDAIDAAPETDFANHQIISSLTFQAWAGIALWMSFGLLNEGLIGFRIPAYVADETRRELFRLAHAHGTLLSLMLLGAAFCVNRSEHAPVVGIWALRIGSIALPVGFLAGGIWHFKGDPGLGVWLVPPAALLVIFGAITMALASLRK